MDDHEAGKRRAVLAVVLAGAMVTYGGVSLFVAFFVLAPMAQELFRSAGIPRRLMPAAIVLGTSTFTMSAMPGTPSIQNAIPMPFFGTTPFAAPGLGIIASAIMLGFGLWWLEREARAARLNGEAFGDGATASADSVAANELLRERATTAREFDPAELTHGAPAKSAPQIFAAALPLVVVVVVNLSMTLLILPRLDFGIGGGPLVSLAVATNILAALTGSASGGLTIALDALGSTYTARAAEIGLSPDLLHRVAVIGSGTLDSLPHNGAVGTLLAVCGATHRESYRDIVMVGIVGAILALLAVIALGSFAGSF